MTNRTEMNTQILIHITVNTLFLMKKVKLYNGWKKASSTNGAGITGCQPVENENRSITMHKTQVKMDWRPQYKSDYTEPDRGESGT